MNVGFMVAETKFKILLCCGFRRYGTSVSMLVEDMSRNKCFSQVRTSHVLRFILTYLLILPRISLPFLLSELDGGEWSASRFCRLTPLRKSPRHPLDRKLGGPQSRSGRFGEEKHFAPDGNRTPAVQPVAISIVSIFGINICNIFFFFPPILIFKRGQVPGPAPKILCEGNWRIVKCKPMWPADTLYPARLIMELGDWPDLGEARQHLLRLTTDNCVISWIILSAEWSLEPRQTCALRDIGCSLVLWAVISQVIPFNRKLVCNKHCEGQSCRPIKCNYWAEVMLYRVPESGS
jgi:hypothetical protein